MKKGGELGKTGGNKEEERENQEETKGDDGR